MLNLMNENVKIENGILTAMDQYLKEVSLPEGVEKISLPKKNLSYLYLSDFYKSEVISCPKSLKIIDDNSFLGYKLLKNINLYDGLEIIGNSALGRCESLREITIPNSVKSIGKAAFYSCTKLKNIKLPDDLEIIREETFSGCSGLDNINLPNKIKTIEKNAFSSCGLEEITIPSSLEHIGSGVFYNCHDLRKITFQYSSFQKLQKVLSCILNSTNNLVIYNSIITFVFKGPQLSDEQKDYIINGLKSNYGLRIKVFFEKLDNVKILNDNEIELSNGEIIKDKEIRDLVQNILKTSKHLPIDLESKVEEYLEKELSNYKKDIMDAKPKFSMQRPTSTLGKTIDIKSYKMNIIAKLNFIIYSLSTVEGYIKDLDEIKKYLELMNLVVEKNGKLIEDNRTDHNIVNILIHSYYLDPGDKYRYLNVLRESILSAQDGVSSQIKDSLENNKKLVLNEIDYKRDLQLKVAKIYEEVKSIAAKRKPFLDLYDIIDNPKEEHTGGNNIDDIINSIMYVRSKLKNPEYQYEIYDELNRTTKKYKDIIINTLKNKSLIQNTNYEKIEYGLRSDLQAVLENLNSDVYLDIYEQKNASINDLKKQLERSIRILKGQEIPSSKNKVSNGPITNFIIEILNELDENIVIEDESKEIVINEMVSMLLNIYENIKDKRTIKLKEYNHVLKEVLKKIASAKLNIDDYTNELIDYHKYY